MSLNNGSGRQAKWLVCTLATLSGSLVSATANAAPDQLDSARRPVLRWSNGLSDQITAMPVHQVRDRIAALAARPDVRRGIVHLDSPPTGEQRQRLAEAGVTLLSPLGGTSYFASFAPDADGERAARSGVISASAVETSRKLHADHANGLIRSWTLVGPTPDKLRAMVESGVLTKSELRELNEDPQIATLVMFHADADRAADSRRVARNLDAQVTSDIESVNAVVMHLRSSQIERLAQDDSVMWVEPPLPAFTELNAENRVLTGVDLVNASPYGLDGTGVTAFIYDGGRIANHGDFAGRMTIGASDTAPTSDHATHVAGTVGGDGSGNFAHRGMAPGVEIVSYGFEQAGGLSAGFLYTDPGDVEDDYTEAIGVYGSHISNNSIGTNTEPNGYDCEWQGNYGITGALIDAIAKGSLGNPFRIVWANGNERQGSRCDVEGYGDFYSTAPPAGAKNHITVGSVDSDTDNTSSFSSWGPVDDGRIKPDVSAPGCQTSGDNGVTSTSSSGQYTTKCGTSMAAPTVTGISALLMEQYRLSFPDRDDMMNATLKALLANTAADRGNIGPDFQYGYGSVRAVPAVDTVIGENVIEGEVAQGGVYRFIVIVGPDDTEMKVTVAWDDAPGTPNVNPVLVNDLDLRVIDAGGTVHFPWTLDPSSPSDPAVRNQRDGVNNIEQVQIDNPAPGAYTVEVSGFNIATGGTQTFGAVSNGFLVNCSSSGLVSLGASLLPCSGSVPIQVIDCDLNTSDSVVDTVDVLVTSLADPTGVVVTLTETAPEAAAFTSSISFSDSGGADLLVLAGGQITATYIDADDGEGGTNIPVTSTVSIDCASPVVISASATDIQPRGATLNIQTDEPTAVTINYGTSLTALGTAVVSPGFKTDHTVELDALVDDTPYVFTVTASDAAGNLTLDDNNGIGYAFVTPEVPDFFSQEFSSGIPMVGHRVEFTPNSSNDFYEPCLEPITGLPIDPVGGTTVSLSDDDNEQVSLSGGESVSLYGTAYTSVYVCSNGYLTFGSGDTDFSETFEDHFDQPRVAAIFDDLNPSTGGTVSYLQQSDRLVITYEDVHEYSTSDDQTFQFELFFDGRIAISWVEISVQDAIVGLSSGDGLDPDFFESVFMNYVNGCGNSPPTVSPIDVETPRDTPVVIALDATDDGEPSNLPGIQFVIDSLPERGDLVDMFSGEQIEVVPHTLGRGSNLVEYIPDLGSTGADIFRYLADDGGTPPEGGPSLAGTVTVTVGESEPVYSFLVDDTDPGFETTALWAFGQPAGLQGDPSSGFTGANVLGYNLSGHYFPNMDREFLTSPALDFTDVSRVKMSFQRWLGIATSETDNAAIEISVGGGAWTTLWQHEGAQIVEDAWSEHEFDIASLADGQSNVRVRWVMGTTNQAFQYHGWNIDDIVFTGLIESTGPSCPADLFPIGTGDGILNFFDLGEFLNLFGVSDPSADLFPVGAPDGVFNFFDLGEYLNLFGQGCP